MRHLLALALIAVVSGGCAGPNPTAAEMSTRTAAVLAQQDAKYQSELQKDHHADRAIWKAACDVNTMTKTRVCRARVWARRANPQGLPTGNSLVPIYVTYVDALGPVISLGDQLQPGSQPLAQVDGGLPIRLGNIDSDLDAISQMRHGQALLIDYENPQSGRLQVIAGLKGAQAALDELERIRQDSYCTWLDCVLRYSPFKF